jgi:hypothetical protein
VGWGHGVVKGVELGYSVPDICHERGCEVLIDRGQAYMCGKTDSHWFGGDEGCGGFFCGEHIGGRLCLVCMEVGSQPSEDGGSE